MVQKSDLKETTEFQWELYCYSILEIQRSMSRNTSWEVRIPPYTCPGSLPSRDDLSSDKYLLDHPSRVLFLCMSRYKILNLK